MDLVYMASGRTCHTLDGDTELTLETDDLLLIRPGTRHSIQRAEYDDICIHFIILPEFLEYPLNMLEADTILRRFLLGILRHLDTPTSYLHFHLQDMLEAQNLLENMLLTLLNRQRNSQQILQATTGVLFMELLHSTSRITVGAPSGYEQQLVMEAQAYIEKNFRTASLEDFAARTRQPAYYISRLMRRYSPYTFTEYLQRKRLSQAAYLLLATDRPVEVIIYEVGYDNSSYFHKLFKRTYGVTPLQYRKHHSVTAF